MIEYPVDYEPESMSFAQGFMGLRGKSVGYSMKFSTEKAREIVQQLVDEGIAVFRAVGGLDGDFRENSGTVYSDDEWFEPDFWTSSPWATPVLQVSTSMGLLTFECWEKKD